MVELREIESRSSKCKSGVLPLNYSPFEIGGNDEDRTRYGILLPYIDSVAPETTSASLPKKLARAKVIETLFIRWQRIVMPLDHTRFRNPPNYASYNI